jgi:hypothetical protein
VTRKSSPFISADGSYPVFLLWVEGTSEPNLYIVNCCAFFQIFLARQSKGFHTLDRKRTVEMKWSSPSKNLTLLYSRPFSLSPEDTLLPFSTSYWSTGEGSGGEKLLQHRSYSIGAVTTKILFIDTVVIVTLRKNIGQYFKSVIHCCYSRCSFYFKNTVHQC